MAVTSNTYIVGSSGQSGPYSYSFAVIESTDIKVSVNGVVQTLDTHYELDTGNTRITFKASAEPASGAIVSVYRDTKEDPINSTFVSGSTIRSTELNDNFKQLLYIAQESDSQSLSTLGGKMMADLELGKGVDIILEGSADDAHETTLTVQNPTGDRTVTIPDLTGTIVVTGSNSTVSRDMIADDAINNAKILNGSVNHDSLASDSVIEAKIGNQAVTNGKIGALAVDVGQLAPNAVETAKIKDGAVTADKIATNAVTVGKIANGSVNHDKLSSDSVQTVKILNAAVTGVKIAANSIDSDHYVDGSIDNAHIANGAVNHDKISSDSVLTDKIQNEAVTNPKLGNNAVTAAKIATNAVEFDKIHEDVTIISSEASAHTANDTTIFTTSGSDTRYYRQDTSETINSGMSWSDSDSFIATTKAIDNRIVDLVDEVGGFFPIANETSFPSTNPDIDNGAGTIVSVKALSSAITTTSNTTHTINNGAGTGTNVIITGLEANTTYQAGWGFLVETTSTTHTYAFHRLVPKSTEVSTVSNSIANVNTVAGSIANVNTVAAELNESTSEIDTVADNIVNINNVGNNIASVTNCNTNLTAIEHYGDTYQVATGAPTQRPDGSSLVVGDLWFDSSSNKALMVNDGSAGDGYSAIAPSQSVMDDIAIVSGNITWQEDLGSIGDAISTGTGNSIELCADKATEIGRLGTAAAVADLAILGTTDVVADLNTLGTTAIVADLDAVADKVTEIGRLGTTAAIADMAILGTADCVADMAILGTTDVVADLNTLATADVVADMNTLATSDIVSDMNTLATSANVTAMDNCSGSIANINTTSGSIANVNTVGGSISNVNTVGAAIADVNRYANEYKIAASAPGSPSEGDLWYDSNNNLLKYYTGSSWTGISDAGINDMVEDTTPELGGHLDCNDKNLTEVGTVSGNNLQIDFGTL